jgi:hypothetical protein
LTHVKRPGAMNARFASRVRQDVAAPALARSTAT